eukprot:1547444-Rhodomonas_salina.1
MRRRSALALLTRACVWGSCAALPHCHVRHPPPPDSSIPDVSTGHLHHTRCQYRASRVACIAPYPTSVPDISYGTRRQLAEFRTRSRALPTLAVAPPAGAARCGCARGVGSTAGPCATSVPDMPCSARVGRLGLQRTFGDG